MKAVIQEALASHQAGRYQQARKLYEQALAADPDNADLLYRLGMLFAQQGEFDAAARNLSAAVGAGLHQFQLYYDLARVLACAGKDAAAAEWCRRALAIKADFDEGHNTLGHLLQKKGDLEGARVHFEKALALNPHHFGALVNLGGLFKFTAHGDEALACYRKALVIHPERALIHSLIGDALLYQHKFEEAIASYRQGLALEPENATAYCHIARVQMLQGNSADAAANCRQALKIDRRLAAAYFILVYLKDYFDYQHDVEDIVRLLAHNKLPIESKIELSYTLSYAYEDLGKDEQAFDYLLQANQLVRSTIHCSIEDEKQKFAQITEIFNERLFAEFAGAGDPDPAPVFIVGMPRSGSSLLEQILSCHSQVYCAGESRALGRVLADCLPGKELSALIQQLDSPGYARLGAEYMAHIRKGAGPARYFVNKLLVNFQLIGLIKLILPNAKIIHCKRDPVDTCLSCFKQNFTGRIRYTYDLTELGEYYRLYSQLMSYWHALLPGFILDLRYEDMVRDQQTQIKRLLDYLGLPMEDACLEFHKSRRRVFTASATQVSRPVYKSSVGTWKKYSVQLEPLLGALGISGQTGGV